MRAGYRGRERKCEIGREKGAAEPEGGREWMMSSVGTEGYFKNVIGTRTQYTRHR